MSLRSRLCGLMLCCLLPLAGGAAAAALSDSVAVPAGVYFHKSYSGKIGARYPFTMELFNRNGELSGAYRYTGKGELYLKGRIDAAGAFTLEEQAGSKRSGSFRGTLAERTIAGTWESADGAKTWAFSAHQTADIKIGSKKEILAAAAGSYTLSTISGAGGANAMWDTWNEKGRWTSTMSALSRGRREASNIPLSNADRQLLDSMRVELSADMRLRLLARGKTVLDIPYRANGVQFEVKNGGASPVADLLKALASGPSVVEEDLYLLVRDGVDLSASLAGQFQGDPSGILLLSYSVSQARVDVRFVDPACCGESTFSFKRAVRR
jgi:hypothetical protein